MATFPTIEAKELRLPATSNDCFPLKTTEIEREVVDLFERFRASILRYVLAFGLPVPDGEEIVQEVFLALFKHMIRRKSCRNLRGWIFSVAHNLALQKRSNNRRSRQEGLAVDRAITEEERDPSPNPEEQVLVVERQKRLLAVLAVLPEQDRWCLHLRAEGLRYREIADVLDISLGTVSASLTRSVNRLMSADR